MQPIVNGLQEEHDEQIDFISLNATDGAGGQAAFEFYGLRGHPTVLLIGSDGQTAWSRTGVISQDELEQALQDILDP